MARLERRTAAAGDPEVDPRRFSFVLSTPDQDRNGRIVVQDWELTDFEKNPIVLWNHGEGAGGWCPELEIDEYFPIGRGENVRVEGGKLVGDIVIASEQANPLAERIFHALNEKILSAVSVGWDPRERRFERHNDEEVLVLSGNRLIEISVVPFPANPDAVRASFYERARTFGTNTENPNMALLATMVALFAMTASATEEQVSGRAKELIELERATFAATGATTPDAARAGVIALAEKAKGYDALALARAEEAKVAKAARIATILKAGRDEGKLTPSNEPGLLKAMCGDEKGATADPASLELLVANLPKVLNTEHAKTAQDKTEPGDVVPTAREIARAEKLGVDPKALAAERIQMARERAGLTTEPEET